MPGSHILSSIHVLLSAPKITNFSEDDTCTAFVINQMLQFMNNIDQNYVIKIIKKAIHIYLTKQVTSLIIILSPQVSDQGQ